MVCFYLLVLVKIANLETFSNLKTVALNPNTPGRGTTRTTGIFCFRTFFSNSSKFHEIW